MYAWIIDKDHLYDPTDPTMPDEAGITGPRQAPQPLLDELAAGAGTQFRMLDGDGELYYTGRILTDEPDSEDMFGPLDDFGGPGAGCTEIQYLEDGKWVTL